MRKLKKILNKKSGRSHGIVSVRHQGGRQKRFLRVIDFKRDIRDIWARVLEIQYDPNRNAQIALLAYENGERRYIIAPDGLKVGSKVIASENASFEPGNSLPLRVIPAATPVHNLEIRSGKGGQLVKSAGSVAMVSGKIDGWVLVKLPSGEMRRFDPQCFATVGQIGNLEHKSRVIRKAGTRRLMGVRPTVRGVAQHPNSHPHGGGEGRSGIGMKYPKTPYGKPAVGKTRKRRKYSDRLIISGRKRGRFQK